MTRRMPAVRRAAPWIAVVGCFAASMPVRAAEPTPAEVFEKRIVPIFKSPNPSSCTQCHLAGVDLKDYILPDAERTFRSLRDQGLIDLAVPEKSKIVTLIDMGGGAKGPNAVNAKLRAVEREAFLAWIKACAADPTLKATPKLDEAERAKPARPVEVIRHARKDRVLESFEANVWAWRFRCMNCHTEGTPQNDKYRKEYGDRVAWVKKDGPAATLEYLIASKLIDPVKPEQSLLLRKPLGEKHEGGLKFVVGDDAYKGFRTWIEDVAAIRGNKYTAAKDLPPADTGPERFGTDLWLKFTNCPPAWGDKFLQVCVFAWDDKKKAWGDTPVAVSDRVVSGKGKLWQHNLTLLAAKDSDRAKAWRGGKPSLPEGKYLLRVYLDAGGKLAKDWKAALGDDEFVGRAEFTAKWRDGYGAMTAVDAAKVRK
ncbi:hypothetical protein : [Gemmataceae bacterium]|nr:hypothetical protein : [Gemmataceae bacterium]VTU01696.1 hypothetical protein : [Gemmataceae bacterium]